MMYRTCPALFFYATFSLELEKRDNFFSFILL